MTLPEASNPLDARGTVTIAGVAGSGKTQAVVERALQIARLSQTQSHPVMLHIVIAQSQQHAAAVRGRLRDEVRLRPLPKSSRVVAWSVVDFQSWLGSIDLSINTGRAVAASNISRRNLASIHLDDAECLDQDLLALFLNPQLSRLLRTVTYQPGSVQSVKIDAGLPDASRLVLSASRRHSAQVCEAMADLQLEKRMPASRGGDVESAPILVTVVPSDAWSAVAVAQHVARWQERPAVELVDVVCPTRNHAARLSAELPLHGVRVPALSRFWDEIYGDRSPESCCGVASDLATFESHARVLVGPRDMDDVTRQLKHVRHGLSVITSRPQLAEALAVRAHVGRVEIDKPRVVRQPHRVDGDSEYAVIDPDECRCGERWTLDAASMSSPEWLGSHHYRHLVHWLLKRGDLAACSAWLGRGGWTTADRPFHTFIQGAISGSISILTDPWLEMQDPEQVLFAMQSLFIASEGSQVRPLRDVLADDGELELLPVVLTRALADAGETVKATEVLELAGDSVRGRVEWLRGAWALERGDMTQAARHFKFSSESGEPCGALGLSILLERSGSHEAARASAQRAASLGSAEARDWLEQRGFPAPAADGRMSHVECDCWR